MKSDSGIVLGDIAALNITAFYKNTEGLLDYAPVLFKDKSADKRLLIILI